MDLEKPAEPETGKAPQVVFRPLPKKPSMFEKVWVRAAAIILLIALMSFVIGFWYWYTVVKEKSVETPAPLDSIIEEPEQSEEPNDVEIQEPLSLISVEKTEIFEVDELQEISKNFSEFLGQSIIEDGFTRILIKNFSENKFVNLQELLDNFEVTTPENFYAKLSEDYTLFIYLQDQGERMGFIAKIAEKENFEKSLKTWEPFMEKDFENLFTLMGNKNTAITSNFKTMNYKGNSIRYLTYSKYDLGICYSVYNDYFIWACSAESIKQAIDRL